MQRLYKPKSIQTLPVRVGNLSCLQDIVKRSQKISSAQPLESHTSPGRPSQPRTQCCSRMAGPPSSSVSRFSTSINRYSSIAIRGHHSRTTGIVRSTMLRTVGWHWDSVVQETVQPSRIAVFCPAPYPFGEKHAGVSPHTTAQKFLKKKFF